MTEELILVEGDLRLPTLRALAEPFLNFGRDWSLERTRPSLSRSEIALFAARFTTAYVPLRGVPDKDSPYRALSTWGSFVKDEIPRAMLHMMTGGAASKQDENERPRSIPLNVGAPPAPPVAIQRHFSKPVVGAVAAACGALILLVLFGYKPKTSSDAPSATVSSVPSVPPSAPSAPGAIGSANAAPEIAIQARPPAPSAPAPNPAPDKPAPTETRIVEQKSPAEKPPARAVVSALKAPKSPKPKTDVAVEPSAARVAGRASNFASGPVVATRKASGVRVVAKSAEPKHKSHGKTVPVARTQAEPVRTVASGKRASRHDTDVSTYAMPTKSRTSQRAPAFEDDVRTYASKRAPASEDDLRTYASKRAPASEDDLRTYASRRTPTYAQAPETRASGTSRTASQMDAAALYALLQHSPTLDNNAPDASGQPGARAPNAR